MDSRWTERPGADGEVSRRQVAGGYILMQVMWDPTTSCDALKGVPAHRQSEVLERPDFGLPYFIRVNGIDIGGGSSARLHFASCSSAQAHADARLHQLLLATLRTEAARDEMALRENSCLEVAALSQPNR